MLEIGALWASNDLEKERRTGDVAVVILGMLRYRMLNAHHPDSRLSDFDLGRAIFVTLGIVGVVFSSFENPS